MLLDCGAVALCTVSEHAGWCSCCRKSHSGSLKKSGSGIVVSARNLSTSKTSSGYLRPGLKQQVNGVTV